jgi:2,4-dichlorophenol 6-monooxygenase
MSPYNRDELTSEHFDDEMCRGMIERAIGTAQPFELLSRNTWALSAEVAERYGDGATWLLGDAAHRFPPSGGLGLNTGLADAFNLAWKVAAVCDKRAGINLLETYELERRDIAIANTRVSLANHHKMTEVVAALDIPAELDVVAAREQIRTLAATPERAARVQAAIDNQVEHFDTFGLDFGYSYEHGAIVSDGTTHQEPANIVTDYVPCTRPGSRLPHAWVQKGEAQISTLDLIDRRVPTLLTGEGGTAWRDAAEALSIPVTMIGDHTAVRDPEGAWAAVREIADNGALLVRPDGHVGWRAMGPSADAATELRSALERILPPGDS